MAIKGLAYLITAIGYILILWSDWNIAAGVALIHCAINLKIDKYEL